jgi:xanthine dehydrogenase YagT iron-sulfur-binding subunit
VPSSQVALGRLSRRILLASTAVSAAASVIWKSRPHAQPSSLASRPVQAEFTLQVNGERYRLAVDTRTTLLDALRERIGLTGTKKGCDHGQCGACTVHIDGKAVLSCLTLAVMATGRPVQTIEGLSAPRADLHPVQQAFIEHDAFQCGYCTPGQVMSAVACIAGGKAGSDASIREFMSGNLCRCAAYPNIVAAVRAARSKMEKA